MRDRPIKQLGNIANQITSTRENPQRERVYSTVGTAPTITCCLGTTPYILYIKYKDKKVSRICI